MRRIDEFFQLVGRAEARRSSEKTRHMIAERSIVRMFLDCHDLNGIVSVVFDSGKDIFRKFAVSADFFLLGGHADVTFINEQWSGVGFEFAGFESVGILRIPYLRAEDIGHIVLHHTPAPCRNPFSATAVPVNHQFVQISVIHGLQRQSDLPYAIFQRL